MKHFLTFLPRPASILLLLFFGFLIGRCFTPASPGAIPNQGPDQGMAAMAHEQSTTVESSPEIWTCSMHPSVQMPEAGSCPLCGMDLIPLDHGSSSSDSPRTLRLEEGQKAIAGIRTTPVERREVAHEVRLVGKLAVNETALAVLSARVGGRLDRLYVDYTGLKVRAGDHMAEIYSPQLFHAQEELIVAVESARRFAGNPDESLQKISHSTVVAARKKLALYGLTEEQMVEIVENGEPSEQITLNAPIGGTVIHRNAVEGQYVVEGAPLYTIADLSQLWLELDVYESDLPWLRYGQEVDFEVDAWPGESFRGEITFLDPVLDPETRTVHVRVEIDNRDGRLRPEMYVRAKLQTMIHGSGEPTPVDLSEKWMCPMHPEIISDSEGECPICDMPLESSESLGYVADMTNHGPPLLIPISAPLLTGDRAIVFVQRPGEELHGASIFEARDIVLGPRAGDFFVVTEGLEEGELVVSRGAFTIDSELQLRGKPSMMAPKGGGAGGGHAGMPGMGGASHGDGEASLPVMEDLPMEESSARFRGENGKLIMAVIDLGEALASDDLIAAQKVVESIRSLLDPLHGDAIPASAADDLDALRNSVKEASKAVQLDQLRIVFDRMQAPTLTLAKRYGYLGIEREIAIFHCPMALEQGADWIDFHGDGTRNPYYGASMLKCGSETMIIPGFDKQQ